MFSYLAAARVLEPAVTRERGGVLSLRENPSSGLSFAFIQLELSANTNYLRRSG